MRDIKNMWKSIKDGLKDSKYCYEYAKDAYDDENREAMKYHIETGLERIEMMKGADRLLRKMADNLETENGTSEKHKMLWQEMYEWTIEEAENIENCLIKLKQKL